MVQGLRFRVQVFGFWVWCLGLGVGCWVLGVGCWGLIRMPRRKVGVPLGDGGAGAIEDLA